MATRNGVRPDGKKMAELERLIVEIFLPLEWESRTRLIAAVGRHFCFECGTWRNSYGAPCHCTNDE